MKVRAALALNADEPLQFTEVDLIDPRDDEVMVKVAATGLCLSDNYHKAHNPQPYPFLPGHESAGVIVKVGAKIEEFKVGDHVLVHPPYCGHCEKCTAGRTWECPHCFEFWEGNQVDRQSPVSYQGKPVTLMSCHGALATHIVVRNTALVKLPENVPFKVICPIGCGPITGAGSIMNFFNAQAGQSVLISGLGTVGLTAVMAATPSSIRPI